MDIWNRCTEKSQSTVHAESAYDLWHNLKDYFSNLMSAILQELHSFPQGEKNVNRYFNQLKVIWEYLETIRSLNIPPS